uniref:Small heat shock protein n=1 Tax=Albuca bracteata TaxID=82047 RepID=A0A0A7LYS8_ALBBR|nr:small heat shock protein [Albuca bracteata]
MSSSALSNLTTAFPVSPPSSQRRPRLGPNNGLCSLSVKAMGAEARDNLDHLQRATKQQVSQQPKRRASQTSPLGLWDRFPTARTIQQMMDTMDRIMEDPLAFSTERGALPMMSSEDMGAGSSYRRGRTPWEIKEKENEYKLRFDMPGMTKQDVKLWADEKMLVIKAEKPAKKEGEGEHEEEEEWSATSYGKYNSRIALPDNVEVEKIKAEVKGWSALYHHSES